MDVYFAPLSCSLATRIAIYELGLEAAFHQVVLSTKTLPDGSDYLAINPKGQVPALLTSDGRLLTEGPAVLQYVADLDPLARLAPPSGTMGRYLTQQWLNYISTEVHKAVFYMLFNPDSPDEVRTFVREVLLPPRYEFLSRHLSEKAVLVEQFGVADAYLIATLNWAAPAGVDLGAWPVLARYHREHMQRPAVARAFSEELALRQAS